MIQENPPSQSNDVAMLMNHMHSMKSDVADMPVDECEPHGVEDNNGLHSYGQNSGPIHLDDNQDDSDSETFAHEDRAQQDDSICRSDDHAKERDNENDVTLLGGCNTCDEEVHRRKAHENSSQRQSHSDMPSLSPNQERERIFCNLGACVVECTPIRRSNCF